MENFKECHKCGTNNWIKKGLASDSKKQRWGCKGCGYITVSPPTTDSDIEIVTETKTNQYEEKKVLSAWCPVSGEIMDIDKYCVQYKLPRKDIKSYKLVTHTGTPFYNIAFHEHTEDAEFLTDEFIKSIVEKHIKPIEALEPILYESNLITRLIFTDVHIGMNPDPTGISLYGGEWNIEQQKDRFNKMFSDVAFFTSGGTLIIDQLGDYMDGWNGQTVRKGHELPQNLSNEKAFDQGVSLIVRFIDMIVSLNTFTKIILNNVVNNNHAGAFDYVVGSAIKSILSCKYGKLVEVNNREKFIEHYSVGNHTFIISHGKDKENLKFGFKPKLDDAGEKKIRNYIDEKQLTGFIEFSKGDSHQLLLDYATSDRFDYMNYMSFAPPSQWVQTNYQKGRSGYVIQLFNEDDQDKIIIPKFF